MQFLVVLVVALAASAQADRDLSKIKPKHLYVVPEQPVPYLPKVVGGVEATPNSIPYQVGLFINSISFCGGSIIRENVVLTAAHCCDGARSIEVVVGAHKIQAVESTQQSITSTNFIIHDDWDSIKIANDVCLVVLPRNLTLDETAQTIKLREASCQDSELDGAQGTVSGWGRPSDSSISISPVLRVATETILTNAVCKGYFGIIQDSNICLSGRNGKGACNGDSGGPLTVGSGDSLEEVGVVSFGSAWGCEWGFPTAYARVSCFAEWIKAKLASLS